MNRTLIIIIICILFSNCTHRIVRSGYETSKSDYKVCDLIIKKNIVIPDSIASKIGEIKLGESGFAVSCSEKHALEILNNEACAINADLIIITEEKRPGAWSSCYRCRADFYKFISTAPENLLESDVAYLPENVKERVSKDRGKNTGILIGAVVVGFIIGFLIF